MSPKYPRTPHFSWSKGCTNDDKIIENVSEFINNEIVITEKCDGGNASLEFSGCYARTHASIPIHPSFNHLKALHSNIKHKLPNNIQLFGENLYAKHSIEYSELPGYFLLFNVRTLKDVSFWSSWEEVEMWAEEIGVPTVPILFRGKVNSEKELKEVTENFMNKKSLCGGELEGIVVRYANQFNDIDFSKYVAKMVRENHVNTSDHWSFQEIIKNKLKDS